MRDGPGGRDSNSTHDDDVTLSFEGNRAYVEQVARILPELGVRVFSVIDTPDHAERIITS